MPVTASDVARFRAMTGAGMMECKSALEEAGGDMDKAVELLRQRGVLKAARRAEKIAAEGMIAAAVSPDNKAGALVEVNCETDFVGKSPDFIDFAKHVAEASLQNDLQDLAALQAAKLPSGQTAQEAAEHLTLKIGERIVVRRFARLAAASSASWRNVYQYLHGVKIGVLVEMEGGDVETGVDVAMHVAASNPKYLDRTAVTGDDIVREREVYVAQLKQQGKPDNIIENIVKGKLDKFYSEVCLLEQPFIKNEDLTVEKYAASKNAKVVRFVRYELGEGIEKVSKDFASEVADQLK